MLPGCPIACCHCTSAYRYDPNEVDVSDLAVVYLKAFTGKSTFVLWSTHRFQNLDNHEKKVSRRGRIAAEPVAFWATALLPVR